MTLQCVGVECLFGPSVRLFEATPDGVDQRLREVTTGVEEAVARPLQVLGGHFEASVGPGGVTVFGGISGPRRSRRRRVEGSCEAAYPGRQWL